MSLAHNWLKSNETYIRYPKGFQKNFYLNLIYLIKKNVFACYEVCINKIKYKLN